MRPSARGANTGVRVAAGTQRESVGRCGRGDDGANLRRIERLAQVRGDVLGDHVSAERLRARVLEARERSSRAHGDHEPGKRFNGGIWATRRFVRAAVASRSRLALGRWRRWVDKRRDRVTALGGSYPRNAAQRCRGLGIPRELPRRGRLARKPAWSAESSSSWNKRSTRCSGGRLCAPP